KMRSEALACVFVEKQVVLKRDGGRLCVRRTARVPAPDLVAAAYFAPDGAAETDGNDDWMCFERDPENPIVVDATTPAEAVTRSLPTRVGPSLAVIVGSAGVLFLVLSVLAGAPRKL